MSFQPENPYFRRWQYFFGISGRLARKLQFPPNMATKLEIDDLQPGMHLTVLGTKSMRIRMRGRGPSPRRLMEAVAEQMTHVHDDCPQPGIPLRVMSVSLPFMLFQVLEPGGTYTMPAVIDTRKFTFARVDDEYVQCIAMYQGARAQR